MGMGMGREKGAHIGNIPSIWADLANNELSLFGVVRDFTNSSSSAVASLYFPSENLPINSSSCSDI